MGREGISQMVASFSIEYLGQSHYPEPLEIHVAAIDIGRTSQTLGQLVIQNGQHVAFARVVLVNVRDNRPAEHSQAFREAVRPWMLKR